MPLCLAISIGDVTGIGLEVTLKAVAAEWNDDDWRYLLIGDETQIRENNARLGSLLTLPAARDSNRLERVTFHDPRDESLPSKLSAGAPAAAQAALAWLREGAQRCLDGNCAALVTAPVNKEAILASGESNFIGQTEFLSSFAQARRTCMMLLGCDDQNRWLRVALATTHCPLRRVADELTQAKIELAVELSAQACGELRLPRTRIAVCGLNPHAGEGGRMGDEELRIIAPALESARRKNLDVVGPLAADTLFYRALRGEYDAVVAMYHDQGLVPLKMIGFESGVNWTLGLPFIRTSPDHGTAYDIAGLGQANPSSMIAAIRLAKRLAREREWPTK